MRKISLLKWPVLLPVVLITLLGCGGNKQTVKTIEGDPETFYKQGLILFNKQMYSEALTKFQQLKSSFPDSPPFTVWAELKIGECHFLRKEYVEALAAYEEFKKIHPTHEEIMYVQYQIGMSYFNQMLTLDRDQTFTKKALSNFEYLIANYPSSLFTQKAKEKIDTCKKRLADHEFYVGNFYYKDSKFQAAASRFEGLLAKFPRVPGEDKVLFFLGKSYLELGRGDRGREVLTRIINEYPKSPHLKEAKAVLDRGLNKKASSRQTKKEGTPETSGEIALVRFEEEGKQPVSLSSLPAVEASVKPASSPLPSIDPAQEGRVQAFSQAPSMIQTSRLASPPPPSFEPAQEGRIQAIPQTLPSIKPEEEKRMAALPSTPVTIKEKEKSRKEGFFEPGNTKGVDAGQPIDITSDKVETYSKENLIVFKGNVMVRQKDIVIYADSLEAVIIEDGKGIEKVIAGGNVRIQQGLRVASAQKAVFYNADQKVILTGEPKVLEGDNIVSGEEIIFDIEKDRYEVKGGSSGRGKAKILPAELEKPK
jgi:outer membrane protein assembly factor BamD